MILKQTTTEETEADLEARIHAAIKVAFPFMADNTIKHQIKFSFKFGRQTIVIDNGKSRAEARLDILLEHNGIPLAIMELKRPGSNLSSDDSEQGLSYARLVQPLAPLVVITNGEDVRILITATGDPWQPETLCEEKFQTLIKHSSIVARDEIRSAINTLMGTSPKVWMQAVRQTSNNTFNELMATVEEPARPFSEEFFIERHASYKLMDKLKNGERVLVLAGVPLSGKSNVLRGLCKLTDGSTIAALYIEAGIGQGALQLLADAISRSLCWPMSPDEARNWLIRLSWQEEAQLTLLFDGIQASDKVAIREIEDFSSSAFGASLSVVVAMDESTVQSIFQTANQRSLSPLGRRAKMVTVEHLNQDEFKCAQNLLNMHQVYLMHGADMAPEYREPWVLRAIWNDAKNLSDGEKHQPILLPSLLGIQLIEFTRKRFAHDIELRRRFNGLACSMLTDAQDKNRPYQLVLQQIETGIIRRSVVIETLESGDLEWLIDHGYVRVGWDEAIGSTILVRLPELFASEMAYALTHELTDHIRINLKQAADWISGAAGNLPLGEIVAAQAIIDLAKRPKGLPFDLIHELLKIKPEKEIMPIGSICSVMIDNNYFDLEIIESGRGIIKKCGQEFEIDLENDGSLIGYKNISSWLILSHIAMMPFDIQNEKRVRIAPILIFEIGKSIIPLRASNRGSQSMRMIPTIDMPGGVSMVCPDIGIIEAITLSMFNYLCLAEDQRDDWIKSAVNSDSIALLYRTNIALQMMSVLEEHKISSWAKTQLDIINVKLVSNSV